MKKGFTLVELVGVVVLLSALLLIIIPTVSNILKNGKEEMLENQITNIEQTLATWASNYKLNDGETIYLTLSQLKKEGLVDLGIKNPVTDEYLANDMKLEVTNNNGVVGYKVLTETGNCKNDYINIPKIDLNDASVRYVELNSIYSNIEATAVDSVGNILNNLTSEGSVDTSKVGSYYITYSVNKDGYCNSSIKTVIVRDTTAPVISFNGDLRVSSSQITSYDFLADVNVTDNSGETPEVKVDANLSAITGKTSITYIATDSYGNVSTKVRTVVVY